MAGAIDEYGNFNGVMGHLQRGEADFSMEFYRSTKERARVLDFSLTIEKIRNVLTTRKASKSSFGSFSKLFALPLWLALLATLVMTLSLSTMHKQHNITFQIFGLMIGQGMDDKAEKLSLRFFFLDLFSIWFTNSASYFSKVKI